jgi:hypothetical protein
MVSCFMFVYAIMEEFCSGEWDAAGEFVGSCGNVRTAVNM